MDSDWINVDEAAALLGISRHTVMGRVRLGVYDPHYPNGHHGGRNCRVYISLAQVQFVREHGIARKHRPYPEWDRAPSPLESAYMAGIIDGEGYIGVSAAKARRPGELRHTLRVVVYNTDPGLIDWICIHFGGVVHRRTGRQEGWRPAFYWAACAAKGLYVLRSVCPYLVIKKQQADLAIEFQERMIAYDGGFRKHVTADEAAWRGEKREQIMALNQRRSS